MPVCPGIKRNGERCTVVVGRSQEYCYQHDPTRADERRRAASRAGKSKPSRELQAVKRQLQELVDGVLEGRRARPIASVAAQILNIKLRALELERRWKELEDLEERIERLEAERSMSSYGH